VGVRVRVGDVQDIGPGQRRHRQPEVGGAVGEVDVQPALDVVRRGRDDQLVDLLVVQHLLDRVHRVVTRGDEAIDVDARGLLDRRQRLREHGLRRLRLHAALGMARMPFGRRGIRDEQADLDRRERCSLTDRVAQLG
jgi:hypothetical protein